jgi:hypothetical protein
VAEVSSSRRLEFDIDLDHALMDAQLSENEDDWGDGQNEGCSATFRRKIERLESLEIQ